MRFANGRSSHGQHETGEEPPQTAFPQTEDGRRCTRQSVRGIYAVVCCLLFELTCGVSYASGNLSPYLTSYLRNATGDTSIDYSKILWVDQTSIIVGSVIAPFMGILEQRIPGRLFLAIGWSGLTMAYIGSFWAMKNSFIAMVCVFGSLNGLAQCMLVPACIKLGLRWFPQRKGFVAGLIMAGYGGGAFFWNQVVTAWINPNNLQPDLQDGENLYFTQSDVLDRVPSCYLVLGGILGGIQLFCLITVSFPPSMPPAEAENDVSSTVSETESSPGAVTSGSDATEVTTISSQASHVTNNVHEDHKDVTNSTATVVEMVHVAKSRPVASAEDVARHDVADDDRQADAMTVRGILTSRMLVTMLFQTFTLDFAFQLVRVFYKAYAQTFIHDDHLLALAASFASVFNALGRPMWGLVADRIGNYVIQAPVMIYLSSAIQHTFGWHGVFLLSGCLLFLSVLIFSSVLVNCGRPFLKPHMQRALFSRQHGGQDASSL